MKSLLLAGSSFALLVLLTITLLRAYRGKKYLHVFLASFVLSAFVYALAYFFTPMDLGLLPVSMIEENPSVGFANGLFVLILLFHCFADVSYTTVLTGFSTNLIVHIARRGRITAQDLERIYGLATGQDPVTEWRIHHLVNGRYVAREEGGKYRLLPKGRRVALIAVFLQRLFNTREGG